MYNYNSCEGTSITSVSKKELVGLSRIIEEKRKIKPMIMNFGSFPQKEDDGKIEISSEAGSLDSSWSLIDPNLLASNTDTAKSSISSKDDKNQDQNQDQCISM